MKGNTLPFEDDETQEWVVQVVMVTTREPTEEELVAMASLAESRHDATVAASVDGYGFVFTGDADGIDASGPLSQAKAIATDVTGLSVRLADLRFVTLERLEAEAARPTMPELAGVTEAAEMLGVSRQRLAVLRQRPEFPAALVELAQGPVWAVSALEAFDESREHAAGRPRLHDVKAL